jgi:hypothetical protein
VYGEHPPYPKTYSIIVTVADDDSGEDSETRTVEVVEAEVVGRHIFYNNSYADGGDPEANANDDNAVAPSPSDLGDAGSHDGSDNQLTLTDSTQSWAPSALLGGATVLVNLTDGSQGLVTANTATTVTATLSGGAENDWDAGDVYMLAGPNGTYSAGLGKTALLPGQAATFANYTSYSRGINGIMVDVNGLPDTPLLSDFEFRVGNDNNPSAWPTGPDPQSITVRPGAGVNGSDRVTIIWADDDWTTPTVEPGAIAKQWLQVTVKVSDRTGLAEPDVFYWGNAIGESGLGNTSTFGFVTVTDELAARNNPHNFLNRAGVEDFVDYNRDSFVTVTDELIARNSGTNFLNALRLITVPANGSGGSASANATVGLGASVDSGSSAKPVLGRRPTLSPDAPVHVRSRPEAVLAAHDAFFDEGSPLRSGSDRDGSTEVDLAWLRFASLTSASTEDSEKDEPTVDEAFAIGYLDGWWW